MRRAAQAMLERGGAEALEPRDIDRALADVLERAAAMQRGRWERNPPSGLPTSRSRLALNTLPA